MRRHLQYNWWKYLLVVLLPIIIWLTVFEQMAKPANNARLHVLYVGKGLDSQSLQQELTHQLTQMSKQVLQEITVTQVSPVGISYTEYLTARCFDYDLLILSPDWCPEGIGQAVFSRIPPALLDSFPSSDVYTEVVEKSDLPYAFVLPETSPFYSFSSDRGRPCLLFPSPESVNLDKKNGKGDLGDDAALQAMRYLLEVYP
jgi:hypothetical protein